MRVNIYIVANPRSTSNYKKRAGFLLECEIQGKAYKKQGTKELMGTWHKAMLEALKMALERFVRPCEVTIYSEDAYILNMIKHNLEKWADNGFKNGRGEPLKLQEDWKEVWKLLKMHKYSVEIGWQQCMEEIRMEEK